MTRIRTADIVISAPLWLGNISAQRRQVLLDTLTHQLRHDGAVCVTAGACLAEPIGVVAALFGGASPRLTIHGPRAFLAPYLDGGGHAEAQWALFGDTVAVESVALFHGAGGDDAREPAVRTPLRSPGVFIREHPLFEPPPARLNERGEVAHEPCPACSPDGWYGKPAFLPDPLRMINPRYLTAASHEERRRRAAGDAGAVCSCGTAMRHDHSFRDGPMWQCDACGRSRPRKG